MGLARRTALRVEGSVAASKLRLRASSLDRSNVRRHRRHGRRVTGERSAVLRSYRATRVRPCHNDGGARRRRHPALPADLQAGVQPLVT
jgi:hypothetical protein